MKGPRRTSSVTDRGETGPTRESPNGEVGNPAWQLVLGGNTKPILRKSNTDTHRSTLANDRVDIKGPECRESGAGIESPTRARLLAGVRRSRCAIATIGRANTKPDLVKPNTRALEPVLAQLCGNSSGPGFARSGADIPKPEQVEDLKSSGTSVHAKSKTRGLLPTWSLPKARAADPGCPELLGSSETSMWWKSDTKTARPSQEDDCTNADAPKVALLVTNGEKTGPAQVNPDINTIKPRQL